MGGCCTSCRGCLRRRCRLRSVRNRLNGLGGQTPGLTPQSHRGTQAAAAGDGGAASFSNAARSRALVQHHPQPLAVGGCPGRHLDPHQGADRGLVSYRRPPTVRHQPTPQDRPGVRHGFVESLLGEPPSLTQLRAVLAGHSRLGPIIDVRPAHPLPQRHRMDPEVGGHLLHCHARAAVPRTRTTSWRNSSGYGLGTATSFPPAPQGRPVQRSPDRAADPCNAARRCIRYPLISFQTPIVSPKLPRSAEPVRLPLTLRE